MQCFASAHLRLFADLPAPAALRGCLRQLGHRAPLPHAVALATATALAAAEAVAGRFDLASGPGAASTTVGSAMPERLLGPVGAVATMTLPLALAAASREVVSFNVRVSALIAAARYCNGSIAPRRPITRRAELRVCSSGSVAHMLMRVGKRAVDLS